MPQSFESFLSIFFFLRYSRTVWAWVMPRQWDYWEQRAKPLTFRR